MKPLTDEQEITIEEITKKFNDSIYYHFDSVDSFTLDGGFSFEEVRCVLEAFEYLHKETI